jgi:hypothetical protein
VLVFAFGCTEGTDLKQSADTDRDGWVMINYEEFMKVSFWSPHLLWMIRLTRSMVDRSECSIVVHQRRGVGLNTELVAIYVEDVE